MTPDDRLEEFRQHLFAELLGREGVLQFLEAYEGEVTLERVTEATVEAGLEVDEVDVLLLATELQHLQESGTKIGRWRGLDR